MNELGDFRMIHAEQGTLKNRLVNALSWRIATELCRRDSGLYITYSAGGAESFGDALIVATVRESKYQLRRAGKGVVSYGDKSVTLTWEKLVNFRSPSAIAELMEAHMDGKPHEAVGPTTPRTIGYRVISAALDAALDDRATWHVGAGSSHVSLLSEDAGETVESSVTTVWLPEQTTWTLCRDEEVIAEFDSFGHVKTDRGLLDLMGVYKSRDRRVGRVLYEVLGHRLP